MKALIPLIAVVLLSGCVSEPQGTGEYSMEEVQKHSTAGDCWIAIHGKVYDVTAYVNGHPGGQAIVEGCGKDGSELFEMRPMGSGTPHSNNARNLLNSYYIGDLV